MQASSEATGDVVRGEGPVPPLPRRLGQADAIALFVGIILGSGVFVAPATVAGALPHPAAAALLWIFGAVIAGLGATCYAECAARLPETGGFFVYYERAFGPSFAGLAGGVAYLVIYPVSTAGVGLVLGDHLGRALPALAPHGTLLALVAVLLVGALNGLALELGPQTQRLLTAFKVLALLVLAAAALLSPGAPETSGAPLSQRAPDPALLFGALVLVLWTFEGWSNASLVAGELSQPGKHLGRAVLIGMALLAAIYVAVQTAVLHLLPAEAASGSKSVLADAVGAAFGPAGRRGVAALVVVSTLGTINGLVLTASRLGFAMAHTGVVPRALGAVDRRFGTPALSTAVLTSLTAVAVLGAGFGFLLLLFSFSAWIFYGALGFALVLLRRRQVGKDPTYRAPRIAPFVLMLTGLVMAGGMLAYAPRPSAWGAGLLLAAFILIRLWRRP